LAYLLAVLPARQAGIVMLFILIPFYTSLLVRTTAWLVLLQREGLVNDLGVFLGLFQHRVELVHNRIGVYVAMVHILLPFMVFPIYSVMKGVSPEYMRAARSLGAGTLFAFRQVYLPLTLPGVAAGSLLVFILSLGFYVTPALVGGARDQFVSYYISYFTNQTVYWGMAAALSLVLVSAVLLLFGLYYRLIGLDRVRLG
jgi:putative spermidine/putrescine transport system permease protein